MSRGLDDPPIPTNQNPESGSATPVEDHDDYGRLWSFGYGAITGFVEQALNAETYADYLRACLPQIARRHAASIVVVRYDAPSTQGEERIHVSERWQRSDRNAYTWAPVVDAIGWEAENESRPVGRVFHRTDEGVETVGIGIPFFAAGGAVAGFLAIVTETEGDPSPQFLLGQLTGTAALINAGLRPAVQAATARAIPDATSALARAGRHPDLRSYGHALCSGLRDRLGCEQVVFGITHGARVEVLAVSGIDDIAQRSSALDRIGEAMGECLDLGAPVLIQESTEKPDSGETDLGSPAIHRRWSDESDLANILTLPLPGVRGTTAILSFLRQRRAQFSDQEVEQLSAATASVGHAVDLLRAARRSVLSHLGDSVRQHARSLRGIRAAKQLSLFAALLILSGWFWFGTTHHSIVLDGRIEPAQKVHMTAPFEARLSETFGAPGDFVEQGQILCRFESMDLQLELAQHEADAETFALESQQALAFGDVQNANLAEARQRVAEAKARTLEQRIASATVVAPFSGTLLRGDLEQRIGQTFPLGEPLFEIAPSDQASELRIQVPEEHALDLREGAEIRFSSNARPEEDLRFVVRSIAPAAEVADTVNSFTVVAVPSSNTSIAELRAGMEGLCDVSLGERAVWRSALDPLIRWSNQNLWW